MTTYTIDYNQNAGPLPAYYNETNEGVSPLIPSDNGKFNSNVYIRGYGLFNPAPLKPQTTDYGHALDNIQANKFNDISYAPIKGPLIQTPVGAVQNYDSWMKNINYDLKPESGDDYKYYDEYQNYAYKATNKTDPYLLPFYFSKINVKFIQNSVVNAVKKARNIKINTEQDIDGLLKLMLNNYLGVWNSNGIIGSVNNSNNASNDPAGNFKSILGNLNKITIEEYVQNVLSTLNMTEYYLNDISKLPIPLSNPVYTNNKGRNELGFVGYFEDNNKFTKNINSFNTRDLMPGKLKNKNWGN